jgi:uncharacterized FAD-dependent dehydrogenase
VLFQLRNFAVDFRVCEEELLEHLHRRLLLGSDEIIDWRVVRKGLDARKKSSIRYVYTIEFSVRDEERCSERLSLDRDIIPVAVEPQRSFPRLAADRKIVIVGMGPAGLFAAIRLSAYGLRPTLIERGRPVEERVRHVEAFWRGGSLNPESNVQFGEGGAGTFSDGKLTTRIRDENLRYVLETLVHFGAPTEILLLAKPHIGTDRLRRVVRGMRRELLARGCEVLFSRKLTDFTFRNDRVNSAVLDGRDEIPCDFLVLATGHSARDTYELLVRRAIRLEQKPFAVGVRVEHPQELINRIQYGVPFHPRLPQAEYALTFADPETGRSVYSFCMCPGGVVMAAASEEGCLVTNGMSSYRRDTPYANSALVVAVDGRDFTGNHALAGVEFQKCWEQKAFSVGGSAYKAPAQNLLDFVKGNGSRRVCSSYRPGVVETDLTQVLPREVAQVLKAGIRGFDRKMRGFLTQEATLTGVETRTSSPVRIVRGDDLQSVSLKGLFPTGEGAGYAGGIMSAAIDGIRVADRIALELSENTRSSE